MIDKPQPYKGGDTVEEVREYLEGFPPGAVVVGLFKIGKGKIIKTRIYREDIHYNSEDNLLEIG